MMMVQALFGKMIAALIPHKVSLSHAIPSKIGVILTSLSFCFISRLLHCPRLDLETTTQKVILREQ